MKYRYSRAEGLKINSSTDNLFKIYKVISTLGKNKCFRLVLSTSLTPKKHFGLLLNGRALLLKQKNNNFLKADEKNNN